VPETNFVPPSGKGPGSGFLGHFALNAFYTGAELDPLSTQLADFFGVHDGAGLLVRSVNENSPAAQAGLKAGDVILRVNNQPVVSREDWTRQLRANRGRPMQLSVMRNKHEQTMAMTAGAGKKR
jgi:S1-C subfamily serine protease